MSALQDASCAEHGQTDDAVGIGRVAHDMTLRRLLTLSHLGLDQRVPGMSWSNIGFQRRSRLHLCG